VLGRDRLDQLAVEPARERPLLIELLERRRIDRDDDDVARRALMTADREARVDRLTIERLEQPGGVRGQRDPDAAEHDHRQQQLA
jgi:hypothetical protein